jgi:hypothetical protein
MLSIITDEYKNLYWFAQKIAQEAGNVKKEVLMDAILIE